MKHEQEKHKKNMKKPNNDKAVDLTDRIVNE